MSEVVNKCLVETYKHVATVRKFMNVFIVDLMKRSEHHDDSKFVEPELTPFAEATHVLSTIEYGTPAYDEQLVNLKPTLDCHYSKNRHHPEHFPNGVDDMTLMDLVEMLSDWKAATARNKAGNIRKSIEINAERFKMSPQLKRIFENTVREHFPE